MVSSDCANIDPALLPVSPKTAYYHGLRVYHQMKVWRNLSDIDLDPLSWGVGDKKSYVCTSYDRYRSRSSRYLINKCMAILSMLYRMLSKKIGAVKYLVHFFFQTEKKTYLLKI